MSTKAPLLVFYLLIMRWTHQSHAIDGNIHKPEDKKALTLNCGFVVTKFRSFLRTLIVIQFIHNIALERISIFFKTPNIPQQIQIADHVDSISGVVISATSPIFQLLQEDLNFT